jgi:hypothetical protein
VEYFTTCGCPGDERLEGVLVPPGKGVLGDQIFRKMEQLHITNVTQGDPSSDAVR